LHGKPSFFLKEGTDYGPSHQASLFRSCTWFRAEAAEDNKNTAETGRIRPDETDLVKEMADVNAARVTARDTFSRMRRSISRTFPGMEEIPVKVQLFQGFQVADDLLQVVIAHLPFV